MPDKSILKLLTVHYSLEESRKVILQVFPSIRNVKLQEDEEDLSIYCFTNIYNEEFFP